MIVVLLMLLVTGGGSAQNPDAAAADDPLRPFLALAGTWRGTSSGKPGEGTAEREYTPVLSKRYVQVRNRTAYPPQSANPKGELHEDLGIFSVDRRRRVLVFRQFHVEGYINQYVAETPADGAAAPTRWVFVSEAIENIPPGWRARETYTLSTPDELEEVFELAEPEKEFEVYSRTRLRRVR